MLNGYTPPFHGSTAQHFIAKSTRPQNLFTMLRPGPRDSPEGKQIIHCHPQLWRASVPRGLLIAKMQTKYKYAYYVGNSSSELFPTLGSK